MHVHLGWKLLCKSHLWKKKFRTIKQLQLRNINSVLNIMEILHAMLWWLSFLCLRIKGLGMSICLSVCQSYHLSKMFNTTASNFPELFKEPCSYLVSIFLQQSTFTSHQYWPSCDLDPGTLNDPVRNMVVYKYISWPWPCDLK